MPSGGVWWCNVGMSRIFARIAALVLLICLQPASAAEVKALSVTQAKDHTRMVLDVSGPAEYKIFTLENPHRVVLDIDKSALGRGFRVPRMPDSIQGVRTGGEKGDLRVVFDLHGQMRPKSFWQSPSGKQGHRLVVDLYPTGKAQARTARTVRQAVPSTGRKVIVAIDAGHGGVDPGARGASGTWEKHITLAVARELKRQIDAEPGMQAVMIRDGDYFIPLQKRYQLAREARADLFISVHADAFHKPTASGSSVFVLSTRGASNEAARWLAASENKADLVGGVTLEDKDDTLAAVLLDLSQSATMKASADAANAVLDAMKRLGKTHKPHVEHANFVVLRSPDVPSILVETAFISNPQEEKKLNDPRHRTKLAAAIVEGVRGYFGVHAPPGSWLAVNQGSKQRLHIVSRGETLGLIAQRYGVTLSSLRSANALKSDVVKVGDRLVIPLAARG